MTSLRPNIVRRIERLPKPKNLAAAMQPLFEAVSNAIHSVQGRFGETVSQQGQIHITVSTNRNKDQVWATVEDNGFGLDKTNWNAFTETDTGNKISTGGKGIGRLLWLDCFQKVSVVSTYKTDAGMERRSFDFVLKQDEQIQNETVETVAPSEGSSFFVRFDGLRDNGYLANFPGRDSFIFQHLTSHFLPTFIGKKCPKISVYVGDETRHYPAEIDNIVHRKQADIRLETEEYGLLLLTLMECDKVASADLNGHHFVHFIAHDRTVQSQSIDGKLGLKYFGDNGDRVFHAILTGEYLDKNVNQERTAFMFEDVVLDRIINDVCTVHIEEFLKEPLEKLGGEQREKIEQITERYAVKRSPALTSLMIKLCSQ